MYNTVSWVLTVFLWLAFCMAAYFDLSSQGQGVDVMTRTLDIAPYIVYGSSKHVHTHASSITCTSIHIRIFGSLSIRVILTQISRTFPNLHNVIYSGPYINLTAFVIRRNVLFAYKWCCQAHCSKFHVVWRFTNNLCCLVSSGRQGEFS